MKVIFYILNNLDMTYACDRQTDGQTLQ